MKMNRIVITGPSTFATKGQPNQLPYLYMHYIPLVSLSHLSQCNLHLCFPFP